MENNQNTCETFSWDIEESKCDYDPIHFQEHRDMDTNYTSVADVRTTQFSSKMADSPLRKKGQVKSEDRKKMIENCKTTEIRKLRKVSAGYSKYTRPTSFDKSTDPTSNNNVSGFRPVGHQSSYEMTNDIKFLLGELAKRKHNSVFKSISKSAKLIEY